MTPFEAAVREVVDVAKFVVYSPGAALFEFGEEALRRMAEGHANRFIGSRSSEEIIESDHRYLYETCELYQFEM